MIQAPTTLASLAISHDGSGWRFARRMGPDPARIFLGRAPEEAARLAPLVFNLCGAAHGLAAAAALGRAGDVDADARARRMAQETARDHARAILIDWPLAMGEAPDRASLGLIARPDGAGALARALAGTGRELGGFDSAGFDTTGFDLAGFSLPELEAWLDEAPTGTARLLARLRREVDPQEGRAALPPLQAEDLVAALGPTASLGAGEGGAADAPSGGAEDGVVLLRETGALSRMARTPLLSALLAAEGPSLFARLLARLLDGLSALRQEACETEDPPPGIGLAGAARGLLGHGARVEEGRVAAYRVLSPSAWNCAPGGLLERAFAALSPGADAPRLAALLVSAVNPCVPVTLAFEEAVHA